MRRFLVYTFGLILLFLLQTSAFRVLLPLTDVVPNLLIVFVSSFALMRGEQTGIVLGFAAGLMLDIVFGDYLGFYAVIYLFLGFLVGKFRQSFSADRFFLAYALIGAADFVCGLVSYVLLFLLRSRFHFRFYLLHVIAPETVWTLTVTLFLYPVLFFVNEALEAGEIRRAKKFV